MTKDVKKAILPIAGLATRFLPISKVVSKELIPLADKPLVHYVAEEAHLSGINQIQFVVRPGQKEVLNYFKRNLELEKRLEANNKIEELRALKELEDIFGEMEFSTAYQKQAHGNADAIYKAKEFAGDDPVAVSFCDDIIDAKIPALAQMIEVFQTCQRPVMALKALPDEELNKYGVVEVEKVANSFYKVKRFVQKPPAGTAPSNLAFLGRLILTPDVFEYLGNHKEMMKNDYCIGQVLGKMAEEGRPFYGYEIKGEWLECGNKALWLKSFMTLILNHSEYGENIKKFLKEKDIYRL
ncbi:MAG TPA: sugar phosphate nucleotidyltransferase [Candidatus Pacearchaeota archaeon]|jgi:UTP--glucose-1-phosphate uridylyltransferase|nr:sugar phosphate nucleotidyltransferase [Candidatus Pacearchaeota archaeon]HRR94852.1 sugar phosphate nucleotidyltransferase [Candidatus Paceibacterota bacterium]HPC30629.1 sugar phosphate nucleotidyltransferase [Candidatus Pacearchaeota archaeon]HQG09342.1 sugar phosphate nucleotidyltransferase [Candidatus Pacearchaeota archaeon]HQH20260.1 sugar phosphate nucleotidyltransferase [Candidatus Pacearchaeota archaeon]